MLPLTHPMKYALLVALVPLSLGQDTPPLLSHGPFLGHADVDRGTVWARASSPGEFVLSLSLGDGSSSNHSATAEAERDLCLRWDVDSLEPGQAYTCTIGAAPSGERACDPFTLRTPIAHDIPRVTRIAFGSCAHEGRFPTQPVWSRIAQTGAEAVVVLGDTPYIDSTDLAVQRRRYREFYGALPELQALVRATPLYATWDDHDFGRNDTTGVLPGKENSRRAFIEYHGNPEYGREEEGIFTRFRRGAIEVFLLDTRWFAGTEDSPHDEGGKGLLGALQWEWLERELRASTATFKVLASGMIWNGATRPGKRDHWMTYPGERQAIFDMIGKHSIPGVVLVGGDIHRTRALRYPTTKSAGYELFEFITSPLANTVIQTANAPSEHLLHDAGVQQTFLLLTADTTAKPATLSARFLDHEGAELFAVHTDADALRPRLASRGALLAPAETPEVQARVPSTYLGVSLRMEGFVEDAEITRDAMAGLGERAILFGSFAPVRASLSIIAEKSEDGPATSAGWRARLCEDERGFFEVGRMACRETREAIGPRERVEYHAFPLAAGYCFDVRVSVVTEPGADPFPRAAFVGLIDTFRVALLRRGWRGDYPDAVPTIMNEVAFRTPGWHEWLVEEARARPDDYALPFVRAEMLEVFGGSAEKTLAAYARTIALLGDLEERTPAQHFIWAVCEDGAGLTLAKNGRVEEAIAHYRAGYQVAADLGHIVRAPLAYNLACAAALSGDRTLALDFLERAAAVVPRYRTMAARDSDFVDLRADAEFQRIVSAGS